MICLRDGPNIGLDSPITVAAVQREIHRVAEVFRSVLSCHPSPKMVRARNLAPWQWITRPVSSIPPNVGKAPDLGWTERGLKLFNFMLLGFMLRHRRRGPAERRASEP